MMIIWLLPVAYVLCWSLASSQDTVEFWTHEYEFVFEKKNWTSANDDCQQRGGHLLVYDAPEEEEFIGSTLLSRSPDSYWLGAWMTVPGGAWEWLTGQNITNTRFFQGFWEPLTSSFRNGQPSSVGVPNCVETKNQFWFNSTYMETLPSYVWNDVSCQQNRNYICERPTCGLGFGRAVCEDNYRSSTSCKAEQQRRQASNINVHITQSQLECVLICLDDTHCKGVNYHKSSGACESIGEAEYSSSLLVPAPQWSYISRMHCWNP